ncbi:hypothetical protein SO802_032358 [Lithocarpus litseifolius]|uniref:Uncharacterized protein n=1 Tax=Lithocarpus litseifolius TaxID=425828 RepID=A0AAW2BQH4_9ROSI
MESSSMSSNGSLRKRGPTQCFCSEKPILVVSWTPDNPGRRIAESGENLISKENGIKEKDIDYCSTLVLQFTVRQRILTLEADIAGYKKREKRLVIYLGLSLVISGMLLYLMLLLVGQIGGGKMGH